MKIFKNIFNCVSKEDDIISKTQNDKINELIRRVEILEKEMNDVVRLFDKLENKMDMLILKFDLFVNAFNN